MTVSAWPSWSRIARTKSGSGRIGLGQLAGLDERAEDRVAEVDRRDAATAGPFDRSPRWRRRASRRQPAAPSCCGPEPGSVAHSGSGSASAGTRAPDGRRGSVSSGSCRGSRRARRQGCRCGRGAARGRPQRSRSRGRAGGSGSATRRSRWRRPAAARGRSPAAAHRAGCRRVARRADRDRERGRRSGRAGRRSGRRATAAPTAVRRSSRASPATTRRADRRGGRSARHPRRRTAL